MAVSLLPSRSYLRRSTHSSPSVRRLFPCQFPFSVFPPIAFFSTSCYVCFSSLFRGLFLRGANLVWLGPLFPFSSSIVVSLLVLHDLCSLSSISTSCGRVVSFPSLFFDSFFCLSFSADFFYSILPTPCGLFSSRRPLLAACYLLFFPSCLFLCCFLLPLCVRLLLGFDLYSFLRNVAVALSLRRDLSVDYFLSFAFALFSTLFLVFYVTLFLPHVFVLLCHLFIHVTLPSFYSSYLS